MPVYCVSYDLNKAGQNYDALYEQLKSSPGWWHHLDSTWLISTPETAEQLSNRVLQHLDKNDTLLVIRVAKPYQGWLTKEAWQWIYDHVID